MDQNKFIYFLLKKRWKKVADINNYNLSFTGQINAATVWKYTVYMLLSVSEICSYENSSSIKVNSITSLN